MITSKSNATVVAAAKLKDKKGRREQGKFLIEGRKLIRDAAARGVTFDRIFVTEDFSGDLPPCEVACVSEKSDRSHVVLGAKELSGLVVFLRPLASDFGLYPSF